MNRFFQSPRRCSATLAINREVQDRWKRGETVYHFGFGESRVPIHPILVEALQRHAHKQSYLETLGLISLRENVADFYHRHWHIPAKAEQVVIGPGSKSLLFSIQLALDGHLLLPSPSWVSYAPQADLLRRPSTYVESSIENDYEISIENLDKACQQAAAGMKLLVINSPNNPTGQILSRGKLKELANFCRQEQIAVVSDEIYALTTFDGQPHTSIARFYPEGTIVIGGPSKHLSVGGWRIGIAVLPESALGNFLRQQLLHIASEIWSSPAGPIQYAAAEAYSDCPELAAHIQSSTYFHELRTRYLYRSFSSLGIRCTDPHGAFYFVANFDHFREALAREGVVDSATLAHRLLEQFNFATLPASDFGRPESELSLRIASSYIDMETDAEANGIWKGFLKNRMLSATEDLPNMRAAMEQLGQFVNRLQH